MRKNHHLMFNISIIIPTMSVAAALTGGSLLFNSQNRKLTADMNKIKNKKIPAPIFLSLDLPVVIIAIDATA